jgi:ribosomal protein S6
MRKYELTVLISPDLIEQEIQLLENEIVSFIEEKKGSLIGLSVPLKRDLGYEIGRVFQAYFLDFKFLLDQNFIIELERKLKNKKEILRYIFLAKTNKESRERKPRKKEREKPVLSSRPSKKVELGDIDKKIDEILNE